MSYQQQYSENAQRITGQALTEFRQFMALNNLLYSYTYAEYWLNLGKPVRSHNKYSAFRREILCTNEFLLEGKTKKKFPQINNHGIPKWCLEELNKHLDLKAHQPRNFQ